MLSLVPLRLYLVCAFSLFSLRQFLPDNTLLWNINSLWMLPVAHLAMVSGRCFFIIITLNLILSRVSLLEFCSTKQHFARKLQFPQNFFVKKKIEQKNFVLWSKIKDDWNGTENLRIKEANYKYNLTNWLLLQESWLLDRTRTNR